jgi:hypothetical protein
MERTSIDSVDPVEYLFSNYSFSSPVEWKVKDLSEREDGVEVRMVVQCLRFLGGTARWVGLQRWREMSGRFLVLLL